MATWTNMKVNRMVEFSCNLPRTHVTVRTVEGTFTQSVAELRQKLQENHLLPEIRKIFQDMLDFAEGKS